MRPSNALFMLAGVLLASTGYGATFLLSMRFRSIGGTDFNTGVAFAGAMIGTFTGVSLAAWGTRALGAARMAALAALCVGAGIAGFAYVRHVSAGDVVPGFLVGFGWGGFYVAAPMALVERTKDEERSFWFLRFATFQMAGVGGCPALAALAIHYGHLSLTVVLYIVGALCGAASVMIEIFGRVAPRVPVTAGQRRWLHEIGAIAQTRAVYPIAIIALGACVFSGLMTFQMSFVQGTRAQASTFFSLYTVTVIGTRWLLSRLVVSMRPETATKALLVMMVLGAAAMYAVPYHMVFHVASAILLGTGYGLAYPIVQSQALDDSGVAHRHSALTWFVFAYFAGVFGFPAVGGWVLVHGGKSALLALIVACGVVALVLAMLRDRHRVEMQSAKV
jgi:MFS family permease